LEDLLYIRLIESWGKVDLVKFLLVAESLEAVNVQQALVLLRCSLVHGFFLFVYYYLGIKDEAELGQLSSFSRLL